MVTLDRGAARAWLRGPEVVRDDGAVMSWSNAAHPGYAYPEIAGLWLCAFGAERDELSAAVTRWLCAQRDPLGRVGRDGITYAFDASVAIRGLRAAGAPDPAVNEMRARLVSDLCGGPVCSDERDKRWSTLRAPHLLKCAIALRDNEIERVLAHIDPARGATQEAQGLRFDDGTARGLSYLHAHLYALEGTMWLAQRGDDRARARLSAGARWTAFAQDPSGGLRAWHDGARASGPLRADATAQAVRLWSALDRERFADEISLGRSALAAMQHPCGGLRYEPESDDVNVWATLFALQADEWAGEGARGEPW